VSNEEYNVYSKVGVRCPLQNSINFRLLGFVLLHGTMLHFMEVIVQEWQRYLTPKGNGDGVKELMVPRNEITPFVFTLKKKYDYERKV
jgi:hypothetical protein